ncbi:MAG TPA: YggS family pyridoxal phosphate-dependent enzyme [Ferruginibacter sp.]|nr:YggS family pyridoxal phosphate-dependent enzyme [Ferruginibacter sp.]HRE64063.1 YggS family pyridoxal phosphate-dependent enzyme [Ferruginibacter sp.]
MNINKKKYTEIVSSLSKNQVLVAVSKVQPIESIKALYQLGHRDFGENYVQELLAKEAALPKDIRWHFIGHLQSNKVKYIAPFVHLIHGVDSESLLKEINKQAIKNNRVIDCLLQVHIAMEDTKFGFDENELTQLLLKPNNIIQDLKSIHIKGLMGMASFSDDVNLVRSEFKKLKELYNKLNTSFSILSMGMSGDYKIALEEGSNMIRVGSLIFGARQ